MIELIRAMTRPIITIVFALSWIGTTIYLIVSETAVSTPYILFTVLSWGVVVWWYGDRTYFKRHQSPLGISSKVF